jgi:hypothetical protein
MDKEACECRRQLLERRFWLIGVFEQPKILAVDHAVIDERVKVDDLTVPKPPGKTMGDGTSRGWTLCRCSNRLGNSPHARAAPSPLSYPHATPTPSRCMGMRTIGRGICVRRTGRSARCGRTAALRPVRDLPPAQRLGLPGRLDPESCRPAKAIFGETARRLPIRRPSGYGDAIGVRTPEVQRPKEHRCPGRLFVYAGPESLSDKGFRSASAGGTGNLHAHLCRVSWGRRPRRERQPCTANIRTALPLPEAPSRRSGSSAQGSRAT